MGEALRFALFTHKLIQISLLSNFLSIDKDRLVRRILYFAKLLYSELFVDYQFVIRVEVDKHFVLDCKGVLKIIFQLSIEPSIAIKGVHLLDYLFFVFLSHFFGLLGGILVKFLEL